MKTLEININTSEHTILLGNIKMNQNDFSYNNLTFNKIDDNVVEVKYIEQLAEINRSHIDCNLGWALNDIIKVITEYSKPGFNPYDEDYVMFEYEH